MPKNILYIIAIVGAILLVAFFGNLFIEGWNWGIFDFVFMAILLFMTGLSLDFVVKKVQKPAWRALAVIATVGAFLLIWVELAVQAISRGVYFLV